ncbi:MAG: Fic family protein [Dehalococcoidia bacterium]|nr:Fic family protein [Dehalococcoidia bacterium]
MRATRPPGRLAVERVNVGRYEERIVAGERVRAFVPAPLPPDPPIALDGGLQQLLVDAAMALGRIDGASQTLPDAELLTYAYVRKEAVLSSQIEGTQSSLSDLMRFEAGAAPGVPLDDVREVVNYVAAMEHGLERLRGDFPLSNRLIREIHAILMRSGRGSDKTPGEFRRSQNWIGGARPGNAAYVPPPHTEVADCMGALEAFLHTEDDGLPVLLRAAIAHVQFETIHPFLDGNGRTGRLLITFLLCQAGMLRDPVLYLSLYFKQHRERYYDLLDNVRRTGDWEAWLRFFLEGVRDTAESVVATAQRLYEIFRDDRDRISAGSRAGSLLRVHQHLMRSPILSVTEARRLTGLSYSACASALAQLENLGVAREITGRRRGRLFVYDRYLAILHQETEPL